MGWRFGPGPVFEAECLTASRRVQFYSARVLLIAGLMVGLWVVWVTKNTAGRVMSVQELASIGNSFYTALMGVELSMALMVAPAAAAGAICHDRAKGGLALLMTTELTDAEIVLGRLASRLLSTLGVVFCGFPVLALATLLGGVDPMAVAGATLVVVGVASLSVGMALAFSLWAGKPHEALSATYAVWGVWTLAYLAWESMLGPVPGLLRWSNPFALIFSNWGSPSDRLPQQVTFLACSLAMTAALAGISTRKLRPVTFSRQGRPAKAKAWRQLDSRWLRAIGQASPRLDDDPLLWREWHRKRPSAFTRAIWWTYVVLCVFFTLASPFGRYMAPGVNAFQVSIGLLLACVGAATALGEERAQGGLDVVLATPLDSRRIVLGKWWGAFRIVPRLAILPGLLVFVMSSSNGGNLPEALVFSFLVVGLVLSYGAAITGMGLLIAIAQPKQGRAVALMVAAYLGITVAYPAIVLPLTRSGPSDLLPLCPSPFFGAFIPTIAAERDQLGPGDFPMASWFVALVAVAAFAAILLGLALAMFDRGLGRVRDRSRPIGVEPRAEVSFAEYH